MKIAYICDTGTGRNPKYFEDKNIFCLPLQITCDNRNYQDMEELTNDDLLNLLKEKKVMTTSLPSIGKIDDLMEKLKEENYDLIIAVPICNGLSSTISTLEASALNHGLNIHCVDTYVTAVVEEYLICHIKQWIEEKIDIETIKNNVEKIINSCNTLILPSDLQHLKRGGRLNSSAALLAGLLKIVPILKINKDTNGKIGVLDKVRTYQKAINKTIETIKNDINNQKNYLITIAHVDCFNRAK